MNKKRKKADYRLQAEDILRIPPITVAEKAEVFVSDQLLKTLERAIIYECDDLLIIK